MRIASVAHRTHLRVYEAFLINSPPRDSMSTGATPATDSVLRVPVPARGLSPQTFEELVGRHDYRAHLRAGTRVVFVFDRRAFLPAGLGLWLLSFFNQLGSTTPGHVHLEFGSSEGLFGYLDRSGFLQLLTPRITTTPERPEVSGADRYRGQAGSLVEIAPLLPGAPMEQKIEIVQPLVSALVAYFPADERARRLQGHVYTLLAELIDNVFSHSETALPGYVSLQAYRKTAGPSIQISVSDSGVGIPDSIRATLGRKVEGLNDDEIVLQAFRDGLSKFGEHVGRGCGLVRCASLAAQYGSTVAVRTPKAHIVLQPATETRPMHQATLHGLTGDLTGTHLILEFSAV